MHANLGINGVAIADRSPRIGSIVSLQRRQVSGGDFDFQKRYGRIAEKLITALGICSRAGEAGGVSGERAEEEEKEKEKRSPKSKVQSPKSQRGSLRWSVACKSAGKPG